MTKWICICCALALAGCASNGETREAYQDQDCKSMREILKAQDAAASVRGVELIEQQGMDEARAESGSPWAGRSRTRAESNLVEDRAKLRAAYRAKGCAR